ncbi:lytic polysaccharide monooxygenase [Streptomyces sp. NPDC004609]|uniref:lytic polysaccharide monooxygenase auxiliary activity family 9 protein n=1 Tax=Streptomyces sp. NPDC004609 TaxID=3364704 RepID=UPI0036B0F9D3
MTARRRTAAALVGAVPLVLTLLAPHVAYGHGAPTDPVSRAAACGPEGAERGSAACRAAVAANGGVPLGAWDNLRVADVGGRDREIIPDGQLCSAGLPAYRGLDTPRADWPSTPLKAGGELDLTYRSTIPHQGSFSLYLTREGYDPAEPLRWADLAPEPFATVTDPVPEDGAYRIAGRLPAGLTGRHVLYTIWRNTDTPDTYYSCSDLLLTAADPGSPADTDTGAASQGVSEGAAAAPRTPAPLPPDGQRAGPGGSARAVADTDGDSTALLVGGSAAVLLLLAFGTSVVVRRRGR